MKPSQQDLKRLKHLGHFVGFLQKKQDANPENLFVKRDLHTINWAIKKLNILFDLEDNKNEHSS